jgi:tripartite-type tricarboxylate transporter receptor subunit TctC
MRTCLLSTLIAACLGASFAGAACAQTYPSKPVRVVVASSAGSNPDTVARVLANGLTTVFRQQVVVDNRAGAGGNIGAELAARAAADGYTLFVAHTNHTINATLYRNLSYDLLRDFIPLTLLGLAPYVASLHPSIPAKSLRDFVRLAKARPQDLIYSSAGSGSGSFFAAEYLKALAGINMLHVPYKGGGPAIAAAVAGETSICFMPVSVGLPHYRQGKLRPLAVSSSRRLHQLPEVATIAETIPGYEMVGWTGLLLPAKTPAQVSESVQKAAVAALSGPDVRNALESLGYIVATTEPDESLVYLKREIQKYAELIRRLGLPLQ